MPDLWNRYESVMLFNPELGVDATEELVLRARSFVTDEGGRILKTDRWGLKQTAFEVKRHPKAYYLLLEFAGSIRTSQELERRLNLIDNVLKFQTVRIEEHIDVSALPEEEEDLGRAEPQAVEEEAAPEVEAQAPVETAAPQTEVTPGEAAVPEVASAEAADEAPKVEEKAE